jgi:translocation and assembly module TamB
VRAARALLSVLVYGALGVLALAGLVISGLALYASLPGGRGVVAAKIIRYADDAVAGRLELGGVTVLPRGGVEIRDFKAYDPDGHLVLDVDRARLTLDVTRLRNKVVGLAAELEGGSVLVEEEEGGFSIARAFAPAHPSPPEPRKPGDRKDVLGMGGWTVRLQRLSVRGTDLWWQDRSGDTRLEIHDLALEARALAAPRRARAEVKVTGTLEAPLRGPLSLEVRGLVDGDVARIPVLRATLGGTELEGLGEADLRALTGRFALLRAGLDRSQARALVGAVPPGQDLALHAYAEASGGTATAAVHLEPVGAKASPAPGPSSGGGGDAAVAVRLDGARALGFDVATRELDPSALHAQAPKGRITLSAHGGAAGTGLAGLRGTVELSLAPSRLREGMLGPAQATVRVDRGSWDVPRLSVAVPGLRVEGAGRWQQGGAVSGRFAADADDLAAAGKNLSALLATPLPSLSGRAHAEVSAAGTAAAPVLTAAVSAPVARVAELSVVALRADVEVRGPFRPGQLQVTARADQVASGGQPVARAVSVRATLAPPPPGGGAPLRCAASAVVPQLGKEPVGVEAAGVLAPQRTALRLDTLSLSYPGTRYELEAPATVTFEGPSVDRLALHAGPQRLALEGGLRRRELDARLRLERLDVARLPAGLLPADEGIAGELSADVRATGPAARPLLAGHVALANGSFREERGVGAEGDLRWDLGTRRVKAKLTAAQGGGLAAEVEADLPVPFAGRPGEPVSASARVRSLLLERVLALSRTSAPVRGQLSASAQLQGTVGAPSLHLEATVVDGAYDDLEGVGLTATAEVAKKATVRGEASLGGNPAARLTGEAPLDLADVLTRPGPALRAVRDARLLGTLEVPGLELSRLSGHLGVPAELAGRLSGKAQLSGRLAAPRGTAAFTVEGGAYRDYRELSLRLQVEARDDAVVARGGARLGAQEALTLDATLRAPVERLTSKAGLRSAGLALDVVVPRLELAQAASSAPLALVGTVEGKARAQGSLGHPEVSLEVSGQKLSVEGRAVGEAHLAAQAGGDKLSAELTLSPQAGGDLRATLEVTAPVTLDLTADALGRAPAQASLRARAVDLGFLPAIAPTSIRAASGKLEAELTAKGPLLELRPRGTVRLDDGRVAVIEYGDWTGIGLDMALTDDAIELRRLQATRGKGTVTVEGALRGLTTPQAKLTGKLTTRNLTIARAGMDVVTLSNLEVQASGGYQGHTLDVRLDVSPTTLRLPDKLPRELQSLEKRPDIIVGRKPPKKERTASSGPAGKGLVLKVRLVAPGRLRVVEANPRVDVEVKADVTYERSAGAEYMSGSIQTVRGEVAPISGRRFDVRRGRITFTGGPPQAAVVDAEAVYENPTATVSVNISGPLSHPQIKLSSTPPLDESQIAMLIATGGTELKAGGGGANVSGLQDASKIGFAVFNTLIRDRLPIDTSITIDANAEGARVGYYLPGTSIYVGVIQRFDVSSTDNSQNEREVNLQYAISPRWTLEGRWGWARDGTNNGAASLIWSKDY